MGFAPKVYKLILQLKIMSCFIKKIFEKKIDELVHIQFQKFSRGEFKDRAIIIAKKTGKGYSISTTAEYANELVRAVAEKIPENGKLNVTGAIISTRDLTGELDFKDKKQFQGVKRYIIDTEMNKNEILNLSDKYPKSFLGLSFKINETELKIKAKAPKSGKPSSKSDETPKADFCKLKTNDEELVKKFIFDVDNFKKVEIIHDFIINELDIPKQEKDPLKMRENTIRKGKIIRKINVDGDEKIKEIEFEA